MAKIKLWAVVPVEIEVYDKLTPSKLKEGKKIAAQCITNTSICGSVSAKTKGKVVFYDHKPEKIVYVPIDNTKTP